jgi:hypothetical protein
MTYMAVKEKEDITVSPAGHRSLILTSKVRGAVVVRLFVDPVLRKKAKAGHAAGLAEYNEQERRFSIFAEVDTSSRCAQVKLGTAAAYFGAQGVRFEFSRHCHREIGMDTPAAGFCIDRHTDAIFQVHGYRTS